MSFLFLFLFLGLFLVNFREGVWTMYSPEQLAALRANDARPFQTAPAATAPAATPIMVAEHQPTFTAPAHRPQPQPVSRPRTRRVAEPLLQA